MALEAGGGEGEGTLPAPAHRHPRPSSPRGLPRLPSPARGHLLRPTGTNPGRSHSGLTSAATALRPTSPPDSLISRGDGEPPSRFSLPSCPSEVRGSPHSTPGLLLPSEDKGGTSSSLLGTLCTLEAGIPNSTPRVTCVGNLGESGH